LVDWEVRVMDVESAEKLVNILRSALYLVEHYGRPAPQSAALFDVSRSIPIAIAELEATYMPVLNGGRSLDTRG
jgi:hypothetical protein